MTVRWTEQALARLAAIEEFIAADNAVAARRLVARLVRRAAPLARNPNMGRAVPELPGSDVRELIEGNHRIVYRVRSPHVQVLTVFEGHRRFPRSHMPSE